MRLFFPQLTLELPGTLFSVKPAQNGLICSQEARFLYGHTAQENWGLPVHTGEQKTRDIAPATHFYIYLYQQ